MKNNTRVVARLLAGAAIFAMAALQPAFAKEWKSVTIGTEGAYAPWNLTRSDGKLDGFEVELVKDLCGRMKIECKIITQDWDSAIPSLNAGKYDVLMDAVSITPERQKVIDFSVPYAATPATFAAVKGSDDAKLPGTGTELVLTGDPAHDKPLVKELRAALKGKSIGLQTATVYTKFITDNFSDIADIRNYKTAAEHDLDLAASRIDYAFDDATYFLTAFQSKGNENLTLAGPQISGSIWGPGEGFGFRKSDTDLRDMFSKAIKSAIADGTVKKLSLKWFKINVTPH